QRADIGPLELNVAREPDRDGAGCGETALETGEDLIERAKAAGEQAMRVPILRRPGARSGGCRQPVALQDVDLFEVLGQGAGGRQAADPGSNDDGTLTQLLRTIGPLLSKRQSVFDQLCHFPLLRMQSRAFNRCAPCDLGRSRGPFVKFSAVSLAARRSTIGKAPLAQSDVESLAERREGRRQPVPGSLELASRRWEIGRASG